MRILAAIALLAGCTTPLDYNKNQALKEAIDHQNVDRTRDLLRGENLDRNRTVTQQGAGLLSLAATSNAGTSAGRCSDAKIRIVQQLSAAHAVADFAAFKAAVDSFCPKVIETMAVEDISDEQFSQRALRFMNEFHSAISTGTYHTWPEPDLRDRAATYQLLEKLNSERCKASNNDVVNPACRASEKFVAASADIRAKLGADVAQAKADQTPAGMAALACSINGVVQQAQARIDHENEIGKASGAIDYSKLHDAGDQLVRSRERLQAQLAEYKRITGAELDLEKCPR